jgi:glyoxylase-like metal-dependent hydrolase (beta-lactamase superfamily II)
VNVWAIEDGDLGFTLFDCGFDTERSMTAIANGLAQAGATLTDVRRVFVSHAHPEHAGGLRRLVQCAGARVEVFASSGEARRLLGAAPVLRELRHGDRLEFKRFTADAIVAAGHSPGLTCLHAGPRGVLFSSDHLCHDLGTRDPLSWFGSADRDLGTYERSLGRLHALDVTVVLPGRGPPFAGHRRVIGEIRSQLRGQHSSPPSDGQRKPRRSLDGGARCLPTGTAPLGIDGDAR